MYEEKLRDEIIETKKSQTDLVRLKLVVVGVIGATGLGAVPYVPKNAFALFALIPIVCFFLDLVCFHGEIGIAQRRARHADARLPSRPHPAADAAHPDRRQGLSL